MEYEELLELFCAKISLEIRRFKQDVLQEDRETVYQNAYRIDCMINIYELLLEISREKGEQTLKKLLVFPSLLAFLYTKWLHTQDSHLEDLEKCMEQGILEIDQKYRVVEKGDNAA